MFTKKVRLARYRAYLEGDGEVLVLGTAGSRGNERLAIIRGDGWESGVLRVLWHIGGQEEALASLVGQDGTLAVPAQVTMAAGTGKVLFEVTEGERVLLSADLPYLVTVNSGNADGAELEVPTSEWQGVVSQFESIRQAVESAAGQAQDTLAQAEEVCRSGRAEIQSAADAQRLQLSGISAEIRDRIDQIRLGCAAGSIFVADMGDGFVRLGMTEPETAP